MVHRYCDIISGCCDRTQTVRHIRGKLAESCQSQWQKERRKKKYIENIPCFQRGKWVAAGGSACSLMENVGPVPSQQSGQVRAPVQQRHTIRICLKSIPKTLAGCLKSYSQVTSFSWSTESFKVYFEEAAHGRSALEAVLNKPVSRLNHQHRDKRLTEIWTPSIGASAVFDDHLASPKTFLSLSPCSTAFDAHYSSLMNSVFCIFSKIQGWRVKTTVLNKGQW